MKPFSPSKSRRCRRATAAVSLLVALPLIAPAPPGMSGLVVTGHGDRQANLSNVTAPRCHSPRRAARAWSGHFDVPLDRALLPEYAG